MEHWLGPVLQMVAFVIIALIVRGNGRQLDDHNKELRAMRNTMDILRRRVDDIEK